MAGREIPNLDRCLKKCPVAGCQPLPVAVSHTVVVFGLPPMECINKAVIMQRAS